MDENVIISASDTILTKVDFSLSRNTALPLK
jgi:hypothetical protein